MAVNRKSAIELYRLLLRLQLLVRALTRETPVRLGPSENQVLGEIMSESAVTATRLAHDLKLSKSTISRLLTPLVLRGLVRESPDGSSRAKVLTLTLSGTKELEKDDMARGSIIERVVTPLDEAEEPLLEEFFRSIADGMGAPPGSLRPGESALGFQQRRLARAFGMLDDHLFGSEFNATEYHILFSLLLSPSGSDLTSLASVLPFDISTLSRAVKRLEAEGLIARRSSDRDKRRSTLTLSRDGYDRLSAVEREALARLGTALAAVPRQMTAKGLELLDRCVKNAGAPPDAFGRGVVLAALEGDEARGRARAALVSKLVGEGRLSEIPARLFARGDHGCALSRSGELLAVLDIQLEGKHWVLNIFEILEPELETSSKIQFLAEAIAGLSGKRGSRKVIVPPGKLPPDVLAALETRKELTGVSILHARPEADITGVSARTG